MESDDAEKTVGAEQEAEPGARSAADDENPRSQLPTCTSSFMAGLTGSSLADLEQQRRARLHPAASAVHLVPDIVVEHVSSLTFSDTGTSCQPVFCHSLSPTSPGRQFRTLSDSSVYQLERYRHSSAVAMLPDNRRRATCPVHSSGSLDQFSSAGMVKFGGDDPAPPELEMEVFSSECAGRETSRSTSRQSVKLPSPVLVMWPVGSPYWQPSLPSMQSLGPERSPKANWLRRHSDSNLNSSQSWHAGLRVEPYPMRSRSTGDTLLNVVSSQEQPVLSAALESFRKVSKEQIPNYGHSEQQHPGVPSHLWSTASRLWQERASPTVRKFFSEGSKQSVTHVEDLRLSGRSCSENISRGFLSHSEKQNYVERQTSGHISGTDESPSASAERSTEQTEVVDISVHERGVATERTEGVVEKRMKLKKYLQTRYQMSQHRLQQSSDTDDVFMERTSTPDRSTSSSASATEVSEPKDLSARSQTFPTTQSVSSVSEMTRELDRGNTRHVSVLASSQESSDYRPFHPSTDRSQLALSNEEPPLLVKREPTSPGIIPSGTSVFVFPPALPAHHEPSETYQPVRRQSSSPVPSPLSSGISESYNPVIHFHRFFQQPSFPGEEGPYRAAGLRMGYQHMPPSVTDVSSIYRRRSSSEMSPPTLFEVLPATSQHRQTIAGPEMMSMSFPAARLSPAESFPSRLQSGSQWHRRGHQSSSSIEDPANFTCPVCSVVFLSYQHLADHMVDHVSGSPPPPALEPGEHGEVEPAGSESSGGTKAVHLCPICQRSFSRGDMLTRHVRLHTGVRPYECTLCSQVFSRSDHLTTHQRTHTGEKPYRCPLCDYAAPRRDMVTRHARIHESSAVGHGGGGRRGRRAGSASSDRGSGGHPARLVYGRTGQGRRSWRHRSDSSGFASRRHWSPSTCDDLRSSTSSSCHWSLASSSVESTDSAMVMVGSRSAMSRAGRGPPVTCRAWSTTSAESFESYPGAAYHRSSLSSAPSESPDVFVMQPRYFQWGIETSSGSEATLAMGSPTSVGGKASESSSGSADVAGVMPALQKCSVTSPAVSDRDQSTDLE